MNSISKNTLTTLVFTLSLVVGLGASGAFAGDRQHDHSGNMHSGNMNMSESGGEMTLQGEILDLFCFMKHPANGQGAEHTKCAQNCIRKGLPIGFLSDGEVYVVIGKEHESAKDLVVDFAGSQAILTGTFVDHHGVKAIELSSIEKASS